MGDITVWGANGHGSNSIWTIPGAAAFTNVTVAQQIANAINMGFDSVGNPVGQISNVPSNASSTPQPIIVGSQTVADVGASSPVQVGVNSFNLTNQIFGFVDNAANPITINGAGYTGHQVSVLGGPVGFTFISGANAQGVGSGIIGDVGAPSLFEISASSVQGGGYLVGTNGADTVEAFAGTNTLRGGTGSTTTYMVAGISNNDITSAGKDTVAGPSGTGADTISLAAGDTSSLLVTFGSSFTGKVLATDSSGVGGGAVTVNAGGGSATLYGGQHQDVFFGGTSGNNYIQAGSQPWSSVTGGGNGDVLLAYSLGGGVIQAGVGNETLVGARNAGAAPTYFFANTVTGGATIYTGSGADTITAGAGNETFVGDKTGGPEFYIFDHKLTAGKHTDVTIFDFTAGKDKLALVNYGYPTAVEAAMQVHLKGSSSVLTLSDGTKIDFVDATGLTANNFKV